MTLPDDIILPKGTPEEFFSLLEKLGVAKPVFFFAQLPQPLPREITAGVITNHPAGIKKFRDKGHLTLCTTNEMNVLEAGPDILIEPEVLYKKDPMHFRASGLNHVLCKLMKKKGTMYGVSFSMLLNASGKARATLLGRVRQNVRLCREYGVATKVFSCAREPYELRDRKDLDALLRTLH